MNFPARWCCCPAARPGSKPVEAADAPSAIQATGAGDGVSWRQVQTAWTAARSLTISVRSSPGEPGRQRGVSEYLLHVQGADEGEGEEAGAEQGTDRA